MRPAENRAVVVSLRGDRLFAIRRTKQGRRYAVLPGGGVERDESARAAALRELVEETGLSGEGLQHLWTLQHDHRGAGCTSPRPSSRSNVADEQDDLDR